MKEKQSQKDHFSFQNFLDKLSVTNIKQFNNNDKIKYPVLKTSNIKFNGVKARLLKKCRETNKISNLNYNFNNDNTSNDEISINEKENNSKKDYLSKILSEGADKARYLARRTLSKVYRKIGLVKK